MFFFPQSYELVLEEQKCYTAKTTRTRERKKVNKTFKIF